MRTGNYCCAWFGESGLVGMGAAGANDTASTFDGVRDRNGTDQNGNNNPKGKQRRFHHLSPRRTPHRSPRRVKPSGTKIDNLPSEARSPEK